MWNRMRTVFDNFKITFYTGLVQGICTWPATIHFFKGARVGNMSMLQRLILQQNWIVGISEGSSSVAITAWLSQLHRVTE